MSAADLLENLSLYSSLQLNLSSKWKARLSEVCIRMEKSLDKAFHYVAGHTKSSFDRSRTDGRPCFITYNSLPAANLSTFLERTVQV